MRLSELNLIWAINAERRAASRADKKQQEKRTEENTGKRSCLIDLSSDFNRSSSESFQAFSAQVQGPIPKFSL